MPPKEADENASSEYPDQTTSLDILIDLPEKLWYEPRREKTGLRGF